jgi:phosphoribosylformylglycinamidine synthase
MVLAVPSGKAAELEALAASEDVECTDIGQFTGSGRLVLTYEGEQVCDLDMEFLHHGRPRWVRRSVHRREVRPVTFESPAALSRTLHAILASPNVASKEWIIRQYDHEVQGRSVLKPLVGPAADGPGDAAAIAPRFGSTRGIVIGCGINPRLGDVDPYRMALSAVDEAVRNVVAAGGDPDRTAILDNFSWGKCTRPERLGALVRAARACRDVALAYGTPFISGKDSLNNEFRTEDGRLIVVPPTLLISALGVIRDVRKTVTLEAKRPGDLIVLVGLTKDELGGGHWYRLKGVLGANVPRVTKDAPRTLKAVHMAISRGLVAAAHDLSEGGLAVAAAEMAFAGVHGLALDLGAVPTEGTLDDPRLLFSESPTRFLLEVAPEHLDALEGVLKGAKVPHALIGAVSEAPALRVRGRLGEHDVLASSTSDLRAAWRGALPVPTEVQS